MRRAVLIAALLALAGCGSGSEEAAPDGSPTPVARQFQSAQVKPPAPASSGALVELDDSRQARTRLAYVDETRLAAADLPFSADQARDRALADGFQTSSAAGIISIGVDATEPKPAKDAGANALAGHAISAVQVCLGDPFAQTILGPETMGKGSAAGVGLAISPEDASVVELRICGVPPVRELHALEKTFERRIGKLGGHVEEREIRELDLVAGFIPADALEPREVLALLGDPSSL